MWGMVSIAACSDMSSQNVQVVCVELFFIYLQKLAVLGRDLITETECGVSIACGAILDQFTSTYGQDTPEYCELCESVDRLETHLHPNERSYSDDTVRAVAIRAWEVMNGICCDLDMEADTDDIEYPFDAFDILTEEDFEAMGDF